MSFAAAPPLLESPPVAVRCSVQETPELVPEGETPQNVAIVVFDDLVNQAAGHALHACSVQMQ